MKIEFSEKNKNNLIEIKIIFDEDSKVDHFISHVSMNANKASFKEDFQITKDDLKQIHIRCSEDVFFIFYFSIFISYYLTNVNCLPSEQEIINQILTHYECINEKKNKLSNLNCTSLKNMFQDYDTISLKILDEVSELKRLTKKIDAKNNLNFNSFLVKNFERNINQYKVFSFNKSFIYFLINFSKPTPAALIQTVFLTIKDNTFLRYIINQNSYLPENVKRIAIYVRNCDSNLIGNIKKDNEFLFTSKIKNNIDPKEDQWVNELIIEVSYKNNTKAFITPKKNLIQEVFRKNPMRDCHSIFIECGAIYDNTNQFISRPLPSKVWEKLKLYDENKAIITSYDHIHDELKKEFIELSKTKEAPFEILFIGCGLGNEIVGILQFLKENNTQFVIYGIDSNEENIKIAQSRPEFSNSPVFFITGDVEYIEKHMREFRLKSKDIFSQSKTTITVSSGFLTAHVVSSQAAYNIFQKIASFSDTIIGCGKTTWLIKRHDAKRCGMKIINRYFISDLHYEKEIRTIHRYEFKNIDQQATQLVNDIATQASSENKIKCLNLIGHSRPVMLINQLKEFHTELFTNQLWLDLREAYINPQDVNSLNYLADLINHNKNIRILATKKDYWREALSKLINDSSQLILSKMEMLNNTNYFFYTGEDRNPISPNQWCRAQKYVQG